MCSAVGSLLLPQDHPIVLLSPFSLQGQAPRQLPGEQSCLLLLPQQWWQWQELLLLLPAVVMRINASTAEAAAAPGTAVLTTATVTRCGKAVKCQR